MAEKACCGPCMGRCGCYHPSSISLTSTLRKRQEPLKKRTKDPLVLIKHSKRTAWVCCKLQLVSSTLLAAPLESNSLSLTPLPEDVPFFLLHLAHPRPMASRHNGR